MWDRVWERVWVWISVMVVCYCNVLPLGRVLVVSVRQNHSLSYHRRHQTRRRLECIRHISCLRWPWGRLRR